MLQKKVLFIVENNSNITTLGEAEFYKIEYFRVLQLLFSKHLNYVDISLLFLYKFYLILQI
ncbi:MAG: hypothetical protein K0Q49_1522 [Haloplasmataceae bacterium]|jgi:hypothetical protein|nr:hypothetical protein [Haloplasmataceae bacterium]